MVQPGRLAPRQGWMKVMGYHSAPRAKITKTIPANNPVQSTAFVARGSDVECSQFPPESTTTGARAARRQPAAAQKHAVNQFFRHPQLTFAHVAPTLLQTKVSMHAMRFTVVFSTRPACCIDNTPKAPPRARDATKIDFLVENNADGLLSSSSMIGLAT